MKILIILFLTILTLNAKTYKIGFAQDTLENDWRKAQVEEAIKEVSKYPFLQIEIKDAKTKVANQILHIEQFIHDGVDFIITSPIDPHVTSLALQKAIDKGIKVILIDRGIYGDGYTTFISPDNKKIAKQAAEFIAKEMNYKGVVLMLKGLEKAMPTTQREAGFEEVISQYKDIKIIKKRANYLRTDAIKAMDEIYKDNIKFDAIYSHSDSMLIGAREVMAKNKDFRKIPTVGIDYIKDAKDAIAKGSQSASFTYPTVAKDGIEAIVRIIQGENVEKNVTIDTTIVTKDNVYKIEPIF
ncbi:substrate-binding domain-containing protein [Arcobacter sp. FWKO B]|uniref:substrate-binding domain-containing protein n=1 Tax=Arcobacter sp. FWKO B TaxID=2593672 RepID=UPI0018A3EB6C|nr:substrate-binding domain-containing protein [Arcobacter sp. FWKO B]QOG12531.1 substrate-binding domain-containing protein [Arcobacter sp. FWKO B]